MLTGCQGLLGHGCADYIDAIHGGVPVQDFLVSGDPQAVLHNVNPEILPDLELGKHGPRLEADLAFALQGLVLAGAGVRDLLQFLFREIQQNLPLARLLLGCDRVEARDQALGPLAGMQ